jgi:hypothetical protein
MYDLMVVFFLLIKRKFSCLFRFLEIVQHQIAEFLLSLPDFKSVFHKILVAIWATFF